MINNAWTKLCATCGEKPSKYTVERCPECEDHYESWCDQKCDEVRDERGQDEDQ